MTIIKKLLAIKLVENPDMTQEEWQNVKNQFLTFLFAMFIKENPDATEELARHCWDELQVKKS